MTREYPRLVGALALFTGDEQLAEDCAAEALARVTRDWSRVAAMDAPGAYAHRIAMNLARSWYRRLAAQRRALVRHGTASSTTQDPDVAAAIAVREAIAALPDRQRASIVLRHYSGLEPSEIAQVLGVSPGTVRSNLHDARQRLRELLDDEVAVTDDEEARR